MGYAITDIEAADKFVQDHSEDVRYVEAWDKWAVWRGDRWVVGQRAEINSKAESTVRKFEHEALSIPNPKDREEAIRCARQLQSDSRIRAMLNRSKGRITASPDVFDKDPWLLNTYSGTVDLKNGMLHKYERKDFLTRILPIPFLSEWSESVHLGKLRCELGYDCPRWMDFLNTVLQGKQPLIQYMQKVVGYCLTGDISDQSLFILYGEGGNGKTTFLETIRLLLGDYAHQTNFSAFLAQKNDKTWHELARLKGARLATAVESDLGARLNEPLIKQVTGGDKITARFLYKEFFEYTPQLKLFLATNHRPEIRGRDHAIWRRVRLIPFSARIPRKDQDPYLLPKLMEELPEILSWAVEGCLLWQDSGLEPPAEVTAATEKYKEEMDMVKQFLDDFYVLPPGKKARASELHEAYSRFCEAAGKNYMKLSRKALAEELRRKGIKDKRDKLGNYWEAVELPP